MPTTESKLLDQRGVEEIEARAAKATPGPWEVYPDSRPDIMTAAKVNSGYMGERHLFAMDKYGEPWGQDFQNEDDAEFIAHAREDIPALCATVKHLWAENEALKRTADIRYNQVTELRGQLAQVEKELVEEKRLRTELKQIARTGIQEVSSVGTAMKDIAIIDFRSRAIQLCKDKAADYERAMRNRQTREAFTKTYADAANEIREALEAH